MDDYYIIKSPGEGEYTDRKSRFIGHAMPISGEQEAIVIIDQVKRKYWDARHNCYAYITGDNGEITRCSDDGEPSGTAGRPILDCLNNADLRNALIIVTRYFGGTLLGTGGLVRAYTQAANAALNAAQIRHMQKGSLISIRGDYNSAEKIRRYLEQSDIIIRDTTYTEEVETVIAVTDRMIDSVLDSVTQVSSGRAMIQVLENGYYDM
ncbi:MAG: YigZ family protein [Lachnospiraceae bacterium]|nr:YigZ family protein [Lachnospiraceae bacterium]